MDILSGWRRNPTFLDIAGSALHQEIGEVPSSAGLQLGADLFEFIRQGRSGSLRGSLKDMNFRIKKK